MKKNFIKYLACALVAVMILGTTAFAATTTTTTYKGEYITVSTQVTDAAENEQVTYLVYQESDGVDGIADSEIIYINQKAAEGTTATFDYKVVKGSALPSGSKIIAGSTSGVVSATQNDTIDPGYVTITDNTGLENAYSLDYEAVGTNETATLTITSTANGVFKLDGEEVFNSIDLVAGEYVLTFEAAQVPEDPTITETDKVEVEGESVTLFSTVANLPTGATYGVQLTVNGASQYFPAIDSVDGKYAVKLVDVDKNILIGEYEVKAYYEVDGNYTLAD